MVEQVELSVTLMREHSSKIQYTTTRDQWPGGRINIGGIVGRLEE